MPTQSYFQMVVNALRSGPKFGWEIQVDWKKKELNILYRRRRVSRSSKAYNINGSPSYAYALPEFDGKSWSGNMGASPTRMSFNCARLRRPK